MSEKEGPQKGLEFGRVFSDPDKSPFDAVAWTTRTAEIKDAKGNDVFRQEGVEFPDFYSQLAVNIVASKYFYGDGSNGNGCPSEGKREFSLKQLITRVAKTIADWGVTDGYFGTETANVFQDELTCLLLHQYGSFNSPVWFNLGLWHQYRIAGDTVAWRWDPESQRVVPLAPGEVYKYPQISACYIQGVEDNMDSIMDLAKAEAMLFKGGSGTGTDLSTLRSTREKLTGGGRPSGPVSFFRVYDTIAGIVKSGGKTRRAARMNTLLCDHPDVLDFAVCKVKEDRKARALIAAGYSSGLTGDHDEAYSSVAFQNTNISMRARDEFMAKAAGDDPDPLYWTKAVTDGSPVEHLDARNVLNTIAESTWECGDPGMQFHDTLNAWNTVPNTAELFSSNPCGEYNYINNSACNLASLNLMKFVDDAGEFDDAHFEAAVRIFIIAQEILVDRANYPTEKIALNSHDYRPLGLGYANLGALLMASGLPYDSDEGRAYAGAITALMQGRANHTSAVLAAVRGPFVGYAKNAEPMAAIMRKHRSAAEHGARAARDAAAPFVRLWYRACKVWFNETCPHGARYGYRNGQVSVIAPTGTIAFKMDCDTTGLEPDLALVKYKKLAGGGQLKIVNQAVPRALRKLGYKHEPVYLVYGAPEFGVITDDHLADMVKWVEEKGSFEGYPLIDEKHLAVFDCAFPIEAGGRAIHWKGHVKMMAAIQPFISGALSKSVNLPNEATVSDIRDAYILGWRLGLKSMAIYRDGSKGVQPLNTKEEKSDDTHGDRGDVRTLADPVDAPTVADGGGGADVPADLVRVASGGVTDPAPCSPCRERLPDTRRSLTHKFSVGGHEGYVTAGLYPDGRPGELFVTMAKEGSTIGGLMDVVGTATSIGLQYGVPLDVFVDKFAHSRFEPSGFTKNPDVPIAASVVDYIFRWLGMEFIDGYRAAHSPNYIPPEAAVLETVVETVSPPPITPWKSQPPPAKPQSDAPICDVCGSLTVRSGVCHRCPNCGSQTGCG